MYFDMNFWIHVYQQVKSMSFRLFFFLHHCIFFNFLHFCISKNRMGKTKITKIKYKFRELKLLLKWRSTKWQESYLMAILNFNKIANHFFGSKPSLIYFYFLCLQDSNSHRVFLGIMVKGMWVICNMYEVKIEWSERFWHSDWIKKKLNIRLHK